MKRFTYYAVAIFCFAAVTILSQTSTFGQQPTPTPPPIIIKISGLINVSHPVKDKPVPPSQTHINEGFQLPYERIDVAKKAGDTSGKLLTNLNVVASANQLQAKLSSLMEYENARGPTFLRIANAQLIVGILILDTPENEYALSVYGGSAKEISVTGSFVGKNIVTKAEATSVERFTKEGPASSFTPKGLCGPPPNYPGAKYKCVYNERFITDARGSVGSNVTGAANLFADAILTLNITANVTRKTPKLEFYALNSPLDTNPNVGNGLRIFSDRDYPNDIRDKRRVKVVAHNFSPNLPLIFKSFDPDDPTDSPIIDPNKEKGNDNHGDETNASKAGILTISGGQNGTDTITVMTDSNGKAEVDLIVSLSPGDNYIVAASHDGSALQDEDGNYKPDARAAATPMLTVWRRIFIYKDAMKPVTGNIYNGKIKDIEFGLFDGVPSIRLLCDFDLPAPPGNLPPPTMNAIANGAILIESSPASQSLYITRNWNVLGGIVVEVLGTISMDVIGKRFQAWDDDDVKSRGRKDGDEGQRLSSLDDGLPKELSLLQNSDTPDKNVFAPAYIRPEHISVSEDAPFYLNFPTDLPIGIMKPLLGKASSVKTLPDFRPIYMLTAYQPDEVQDGDHSSRKKDGTITQLFLFGGEISGSSSALIFRETIRDFNNPRVQDPAKVGAHETGHAIGLDHSPGGLMANGDEHSKYPGEEKYRRLDEKSIKLLRKLIVSAE